MRPQGCQSSCALASAAIKEAGADTAAVNMAEAMEDTGGPQHDVNLLERAEVPWYFSRGHELDSHCGRSLFRLWFLDFGCPACEEGLRATFGHEPVNPGPFGTGVVCALAVP